MRMPCHITDEHVPGDPQDAEDQSDYLCGCGEEKDFSADYCPACTEEKRERERERREDEARADR